MENEAAGLFVVAGRPIAAVQSGLGPRAAALGSFTSQPFTKQMIEHEIEPVCAKGGDFVPHIKLIEQVLQTFISITTQRAL